MDAVGVCEAIAVRDDVHVISQQRGDPEPAVEEKKAALLQQLQANPGTFLQRWGSRLPAKALRYFEPMTDDYVVQFGLRKLQVDQRRRATTVRNRRYRRMQQLLQEGTFFSEEAMKERCPWLYDQFVGRYLSDAEVEQRVQTVTQCWSDQLLAHTVGQRTTERLHLEQQAALASWEEEEEEEEEEADADGGKGIPGLPSSASQPTRAVSTMAATTQSLEQQLLGDESEEARDQERAQLSNEERERLREEFSRMMQERFLRGEDEEFFDYSAVDDNPDLDDLAARARDEQDAYFDAD
ncbi:hypothetical protein PTSG_00440 [Salpingoeca rosetta]|uniref:CCD97-like C-terminal domain-containing protein n=1 Tax=Salpingoeca rosetta (strain ATCC 50818 / BSB-021) TaxID=946362 RepID=F2TWH5_SALR5|nr:uncharacterized protein PTSG_00440 [Salpingoeca rosetta]EGD72421.1 hypothetical protein PTSG_00440 [Salpingoeca rosetta]|eukprot:XP_004998990.1 hypothetical protein PTSG_00440 [Salpingoeca rosetta]